MVQGGWQLRLEVIRQLLQGTLSASAAARRLRCSARILGRYRLRFLQNGSDGLRDHRQSNYHKISPQDELRIVQTKEQGRHRSKAEFQVLLPHEEPRRVCLDSTNSDYDHSYRVPRGYLKCRTLGPSHTCHGLHFELHYEERWMMIRTYKRSEGEPLLQVVIESTDDKGSEEIQFTNRGGTKRYRLLISSTGVRLNLVSHAARRGWDAKGKAA